MNFAEIGKEIGLLVESKNKAYNNSLNSVGEILKILYPNGIEVKDYDIVSTLVRLLDKIKRLAANSNDMESWKDIAGYAVLKLGLNNVQVN